MGMNPAMARAIATADQMGGGNWPRDGRYLWAVERIWQKDGYKGSSFIFNCYVAEAAATSPSVQPNAVGSTVSYPINMSKNPVAKQLIKTALCGILGEDVATDPAAKARQDQEIEALLVGYTDPRTGRPVPSVLDPEQPLRGCLVAVEAWTGQTVGKGTPITKYNFRHVKMSDQDKANWRAKLDKEKPLGSGDTTAFGQQPQPAFGQQQAQPFGQPQAQPQFGQPQAPAFGQPPMQQPQFGQPQAPAFGQPPMQQPQFGQQQAPAFGQQQAPAFGQQQAPAFGQQQGQPQPMQQPQFGQPQWPK